MGGNHKLTGRSAVVTGSTSGIGLGIARALAGSGANIMLNGFGERAMIDELMDGFNGRYQVNTVYSDADMSKPEDISGMIDLAKDEFGGVDILVNNAGIQHVAPIEDFPIEKWNAIIAIDLSSAFHTSRL